MLKNISSSALLCPSTLSPQPLIQVFLTDNKDFLPKFLLGNRLETGLLPTLDGSRPKIRLLSVLETGQPEAGLLPALNRAGALALP